MTSVVTHPKPGEPLESKITPDVVAKMRPDASITEINANLPILLKALNEFGMGDPDMALLALSTIRATVRRFTPVEEHPSQANTSPGGQPFDLYDIKRDLGNHGPPDGSRYKGRGYVMLTGRSLYSSGPRAGS